MPTSAGELDTAAGPVGEVPPGPLGGSAGVGVGKVEKRGRPGSVLCGEQQAVLGEGLE